MFLKAGESISSSVTLILFLRLCYEMHCYREEMNYEFMILTLQLITVEYYILELGWSYQLLLGSIRDDVQRLKEAIDKSGTTGMSLAPSVSSFVASRQETVRIFGKPWP